MRGTLERWENMAKETKERPALSCVLKSWRNSTALQWALVCLKGLCDVIMEEAKGLLELMSWEEMGREDGGGGSEPSGQREWKQFRYVLLIIVSKEPDVAKWMMTQWGGGGYYFNPFQHCLRLFPCGMSHSLWNFLVSNKEAAALIAAIGKIECYISAIFATVFHPPVNPSLQDPRVEIVTAN